MLKRSRHVQRFIFLFAVAGLFAVSADFACLDDICADSQTGAYRSMGEINKERLLSLDEALARSGQKLSPEQRSTLVREGQLFGAANISQPVKHPNGAIEMPAGWLNEIPAGHPWRRALSPSDDAYYSFVEERIFRAKLFDPSKAEHMQAASAYLAHVGAGKEFIGWSAESRTECEKIKYDARAATPDPTPTDDASAP